MFQNIFNKQRVYITMHEYRGAFAFGLNNELGSFEKNSFKRHLAVPRRHKLFIQLNYSLLGDGGHDAVNVKGRTNLFQTEMTMHVQVTTLPTCHKQHSFGKFRQNYSKNNLAIIILAK